MFRLIILTAILLVRWLPASSQVCGSNRWDVKTLSDADTVKIDFHQITPSSVHHQLSLTHPDKKLKQRDSSEITVYSLDCYIIGVKKEANDKDIHVIVSDPETGEQMVIEILSPYCTSVQHTSRYEQIRMLREWFETTIGVPRLKYYTLDKPILVRITGIGFWDFKHGQKGAATNGREIHPVLTMSLK